MLGTIITTLPDDVILMSPHVCKQSSVVGVEFYYKNQQIMLSSTVPFHQIQLFISLLQKDDAFTLCRNNTVQFGCY